MPFLRTLCIAWNLVRHRITRRLTRLQTMYNVLKYSKTWWENNDISIYRYRTGTGNKFNLIMRMSVFEFIGWRDHDHVLFCLFALTRLLLGLFLCQKHSSWAIFTSQNHSKCVHSHFGWFWHVQIVQTTLNDRSLTVCKAFQLIIIMMRMIITTLFNVDNIFLWNNKFQYSPQ